MNESDKVERSPVQDCEHSATQEIFGPVSGIELLPGKILWGLYGCFIEMADPFPVGTQVLVKIFSQGQVFEGPRTVMHATPNAGVGVSFHDVPRQYVTALKMWLIQTAQALYGSKA